MQLKVDKKSFAVSAADCSNAAAEPLTSSERLTIMFGAMMDDRKMALRVGVYEKTARVTRGFGAGAVMAMQEDMLTRMQGSARGTLDIFAQRLCWDETKHQLSVTPVGSGLS